MLGFLCWRGQFGYRKKYSILLSIAELSSTEQKGVAILPEMGIPQNGGSGGVQISNPNSGFVLQLSGTVDYAVLKYDNEENNKKSVRVS